MGSPHPRMPPLTVVARATLVGAVAATVINGAAIALAVPWPEQGLGLRLAHHVFDAGQTMGLALVVAGLAAGLHRLLRGSSVAWLVFGAVSVGAMHLLMGYTIHRTSVIVTAWLGPDTAGPVVGVIYALLIALCGAGVPLSALLGHLIRPRRVLAIAGVTLGLSALVATHVTYLDGFDGVHIMVQWIAATLVGSSAADWTSAAATHGGGGFKRRASRWVAAAVGLTALGWAPPNDVRLELFRGRGSVGPWVLANTVWSAPESPALTASQKAWLVPQEVEPVSRAPFAADPVVVLITVDALRAEVVDNRANDRALPNLAALRDSGAYFRRAVTPGAKTAVSLTSMFAGRYYSQMTWDWYGHKRRRFPYPAADATPRFPQLLQDAGVHTVSRLSPGFLAADHGIAVGFADERVVQVSHARCRNLVRPLIADLASLAGPALLYAHLLDAHDPYDRGKLKRGSPYARYLSEVQVVDRCLGMLRAAIARRFPARGYLVLASDHGEAFGEHGTTTHSRSVYEELLRVPLIVSGPGIDARSYDPRVGLIDLGPTLLHLFGQPTPPGAMGRSLVPVIAGRVPDVRRPLAAEARLKRSLYASNGLKVIEDLRRKTVEVYDLQDDPGELHNLFDPSDATTLLALAELRAFFEMHRNSTRGYEPPFRR